ncbi:DUF1877 family protein [Allokutzneria albata]|uniref:DUF1877 domain-containing protein n=1 Tax=Allokutzneria albata TaxID=211114 RepID=A0A1G9VPJ4_ALLAB|nr:DUF1877 family protein [Allokutzneria albata]SDM74099.1 protein of unknown function [Allokutzneria albata]
MGMVLSFVRVTPKQLDQALEDPELAEELAEDEDAASCYLDKAWAGIQFLLDEAEVLVDIYEDGEALDEEATLFGWDPDQVAYAAEAFAEMPADKLAEFFDPKKMSEQEVYPQRHLWGADDRDYLVENYRQLAEFFKESTAKGAGLIRAFSF